jgi:hypothetical protein
MLELMAERDRTTMNTVLTRELDGVASANADKLSASIVGFETVLNWPIPCGAKLLC